MNFKYHVENDTKFIPKKWTIDTKHVQQELDKLLLTKEGIWTIKRQFFLCKTFYVFSKNNKIPKLALSNG
jgi:hypothetical protein